MSNTYCVVFLLCFSSSCVPYVASFFGMYFFDCPFGILYCFLSLEMLHIYIIILNISHNGSMKPIILNISHNGSMKPNDLKKKLNFSFSSLFYICIVV